MGGVTGSSDAADELERRPVDRVIVAILPETPTRRARRQSQDGLGRVGIARESQGIGRLTCVIGRLAMPAGA